MNTIEALSARQQAASDEFDQLQQEKKSIQNRIVEIDTRCAQLKGAYDTLQDLIATEETPADQAGVIDVEPTLKEMDKKKGEVDAKS